MANHLYRKMKSGRGGEVDLRGSFSLGTNEVINYSAHDIPTVSGVNRQASPTGAYQFSFYEKYQSCLGASATADLDNDVVTTWSGTNCWIRNDSSNADIPFIELVIQQTNSNAETASGVDIKVHLVMDNSVGG